jgi:hypothetical protein
MNMIVTIKRSIMHMNMIVTTKWSIMHMNMIITIKWRPKTILLLTFLHLILLILFVKKKIKSLVHNGSIY